MRTALLYFFLFLLTGGCVDPANISVPSASTYLVMDGMITDETVPYTVTIAHATSLSDQDTRLIPESGATVSIWDEAGAIEPLQETTQGTYVTTHSSFRGKIGKSYSLKVKTRDGRTFESVSETLQASGTIDNLYYEFEYHTDYINNVGVTANRFNIYVDATGVNNSANLMRWKWNGTYAIRTFPEYVFKPGGNDNCQPHPCKGICTPLPCSGVTSYVDEGECVFPRFAPCTCCSCWVNETSDLPVVSDDQLIVNDKFKKIWVGSIDVNRRTFYDKYYVEVEQFNLSQMAYDFWKIIRLQKSGSSSLFQPVNGKARGNMIATNNNSEVIGLFSASSVQRKAMFLRREFVPYKLQPIDTARGSCLDAKNAVLTQPAFWQ